MPQEGKERRMELVKSPRFPLVLLAAAVAAIIAAWWWLGRPIAMPVGPGDIGRLQCVSYAPFRPGQNPLEAGTYVAAAQIEEDLGRLRQLTDCVRTYSIEHGVDQVPAIAQRLGMKVMLGLWLSPDRAKDRVQVDTAVALAKRFPDVVTDVIVGNEVLLRGDMSAVDLAAFIREVKAAAPCRVTYADVWEFWNRNPELGPLVDFVTIHLLPYWEDFPIPVERAAAHVEAIRRQLMARFPGKEVAIGEVGWPSAGRMREGALPSPANQARFLYEVMADARRAGYRVNVIEAFDQPWKRQLEGTVGGHWGLFDAYGRAAKFTWGDPVSNHPAWRWQAAGGALLAALVFGAAAAVARRRGLMPALDRWLAVTAIATVSGILIGWAWANVPTESLGFGGWLEGLAWAAVSLIAPPAAAACLVAGVPVPTFGEMLGRRDEWPRAKLALAAGGGLIVVSVLALQRALMLVFDPRYVDLPFAPLLAAAAPYLALALRVGGRKGARPAAETFAAGVLAAATVYIVMNESAANWQALLMCAGLAVLAVTLARARGAPG
jgi:exo-beta-1,3-glucanase (GH17 family)